MTQANLQTPERMDSMSLAVSLTAEADAAPRDVHGKRSPAEMDLRRRAHIALSLTPEFFSYRRRARRGDDDLLFLEDWRQPDGSLVRQLAALRKPGRHVHSIRVEA